MLEDIRKSCIVDETVKIKLNGYNVNYYENLGYEIPRRLGKNGRMSYPVGTVISVSVDDLPPVCDVKVKVKCADCGKERFASWRKFNRGNLCCQVCTFKNNAKDNRENPWFKEPGRVHPRYKGSIKEYSCVVCGNPVTRNDSTKAKYPNSVCSLKCRNVLQSTICAEKHPAWNGGIRASKTGYAEIYQPEHPHRHKKTKSILLHRYLVEQFIGRLLDPKEAIHHINENKSDNRIENLYLFCSSGAHTSYHVRLRWGKIDPIVESNLLEMCN